MVEEGAVRFEIHRISWPGNGTPPWKTRGKHRRDGIWS